MLEVRSTSQQLVDFLSAEQGTDRAADWSGKRFGRLPKGTMVTGQGTRIVWVQRRHAEHRD